VIKSQLVLNVAGQFQRSPQREVEKAVDAILDHIGTALAHGDRVELRGFGSFSVKKRGRRICRNPKSGAQIDIAEKRTLVFKQSYGMKKRLNPVAQTSEPRRG
jgi:integration host factor subunit beta